MTEVWRRGSVIASWLLDLTAAALAGDPQLAKFAGRVSDSGEGRWTLDAAIDEGVPAHVLAAALFERFSSRGEAEFQNRVLSAMRYEFGGHLEKEHMTRRSTPTRSSSSARRAISPTRRSTRRCRPWRGTGSSTYRSSAWRTRGGRSICSNSASATNLGSAAGDDPAALGRLLSSAVVRRRRLPRPGHVRRAAQDARRREASAALPGHPARRLFATVVDGLGRSGCAQGARIVVEKPFGRDLASARALNETLHASSTKSSIYRIDHYLGKEPVQNLLVFRFANTFLEPIWNRTTSRACRSRWPRASAWRGAGKFYEEAGAIRDVIQNHLLLVLGLLTMEPPLPGNAAAMNDEQVKVFRSIRPLAPGDVVRGQCRAIATRRTSRRIPPWRRSRPFACTSTLGDGTACRSSFAPASISRRPTRGAGDVQAAACMFATGGYLELLPFPPEPRRAHRRSARRSSAPVKQMVAEPTEFKVVHHPDADEMDAYERLLGDAMAGDPMLFAREDCVEAAWAIVEPMLGDVTPVHQYEPGTWGPLDAAALAADVGGWRNPSA